VLAGLLVLVLSGACIAVSPTGIHLQTDDGLDGGGGGPGLVVGDGGPPANPPPEAGTPDPHAVIGANPSHGPFSGGQQVIVSGKGFTSAARVWFGPNEVDETTTVPVSPSQIQVVVPPGTAGPADLTVQDGTDASTSRTLPGGFVYDALYAVPDSGPVPGGTVIQIMGQGTQWDATTTVKIGQTPCTTLTLVSPTQITCTVPAGTAGSQTITAVTGSETILVLDAYTYADSTNGFKGGLSGAPLAGQLTVLVYDNYSGDAIPGAVVLAGSDVATALQTTTDMSGVAVLQDPSLDAPVTVTITGSCHSPISFVAEPVDTVTAYLDPVLTPVCASGGDPPPVGGGVADLGQVQGQLVWPMTGEFEKGGWSNVPAPIGKNERQTAYVFLASSDPTQVFQLPSPTTAITPLTAGDVGYGFTTDLYPGNVALYAVAGIENDTLSPPTFTAYAMGAVIGVSVLPGVVTTPVYIPMDRALDQALTMTVNPPAPGPDGPDRLDVTVAVTLGAAGNYAILPAGSQSPFLPVTGTLSFVGLPGLTGSLSGSAYVASASAVTGPTATAPMSVISAMRTTTTSQPLDATGFVGVPVLTTPATNTAWDGMHLATTFAQGGAAVDITVYNIVSGNGLAHWLVAVPGGSQAVTLPDISALPGALPPGPIDISVYGGNIPGFDYATLLYLQLSPQGMSAYSLDNFDANL
jgi:hypothetical protein